MARWMDAARRQWLRGAAVALASAGLIAAACGGGSSYSGGTATAPPAASAPTTAPPATSAPTTAPQPAGGGSTQGSAVVQVTQNAKLGMILTDASGMTLYTFKNDVPGSGKSSVPAAIAANWPPLTSATATPAAPSGLPGDLAVINGLNGSRQVTYKGMPLYFFINDKAPGDTNGQGLGGVWFAAQP